MAIIWNLIKSLVTIFLKEFGSTFFGIINFMLPLLIKIYEEIKVEEPQNRKYTKYSNFSFYPFLSFCSKSYCVAKCFQTHLKSLSGCWCIQERKFQVFYTTPKCTILRFPAGLSMSSISSRSSCWWKYSIICYQVYKPTISKYSVNKWQHSTIDKSIQKKDQNWS